MAWLTITSCIRKTVLPASLLTVAILMALPTPRTRAVHLQYSGVAKDIPAGTQRLDYWMPVPHDDAWQQITNLHIESAYPFDIATDTLGNQILHVRIDQPKTSTVAITMDFEATRREHIQDMQPPATTPAAESTEELARWLQPDRLVPLDNQIRAWSKEVIEAAHAKTDLEQARAIYNHVVATVKYDKSGKGWGRGDIYYACENRRGNCTDFHAIFIGYARAAGIPARFAIGQPLPPQRGMGQIAGYHCWAEFYAKGIGWVPVDASEAAKDPSRREYFFGAHDENRIEFSRGRDLVLIPAQKGEALNYFVYPYAEIDGKPLASVEHQVNYSDMWSMVPSPASSAK